METPDGQLMRAMLERHHVLPGVVYKLPPAEKAVLSVMLKLEHGGGTA